MSCSRLPYAQQSDAAEYLRFSRASGAAQRTDSAMREVVVVPRRLARHAKEFVDFLRVNNKQISARRHVAVEVADSSPTSTSPITSPPHSPHTDTPPTHIYHEGIADGDDTDEATAASSSSDVRSVALRYQVLRRNQVGRAPARSPTIPHLTRRVSLDIKDWQCTHFILPSMQNSNTYTRRLFTAQTHHAVSLLVHGKHIVPSLRAIELLLTELVQVFTRIKALCTPALCKRSLPAPKLAHTCLHHMLE
jgi:hypothetical protein